MATVQSILRDILDDLRGSDFKRFKNHLADKGDIPKGKLEKADTDDTVGLLVDKYVKAKAGVVVLGILKAMRENELATKLETELKKAGVSVNGDSPLKEGHNSPGSQSINVSASSGGSVKTNVISGSSFGGSVTFN